MKNILCCASLIIPAGFVRATEDIDLPTRSWSI